METSMLIGGEWRRAASAEEIEVVNPATEEVVASAPSGEPADVEFAVATAKGAFPGWAATDVEERATILAKAAELIEANAKALAVVLTSEQGKPIAEAIGEVKHLAHGVRYYAEAATKVRGAYQELPSRLAPPMARSSAAPWACAPPSRRTISPSRCWGPRSRPPWRWATPWWPSPPPRRRWPRSSRPPVRRGRRARTGC